MKLEVRSKHGLWMTEITILNYVMFKSSMTYQNQVIINHQEIDHQTFKFIYHHINIYREIIRKII